jgi:hypothetical protein
MTVTVRTNRATNPAAASTTGWAAVAGTGGTAALSNQSSGGAFGSTFNRVAWTVATTAVSGGISYTCTGLSASTTYAIQIWVRSSVAQAVNLSVAFQTNVPATVNTVTSSNVALTANTWTQIGIVGTSGAGVTQAVITVAATTGGVNWANGNTFDGDAVLVEAPPVARTNMCTNPSLETDATGWSVTSGSVGTLGGALNTSGGYVGSNFYRATVGTAYSSMTNPGWVNAPVGTLTAGQTYTFSAYVRVSVARQIAFDLVVTTPTQVEQFGTYVTIPANTWTRISATWTIPSSNTGATQVRIRPLNGDSNLWGAGETLDVDAVLIEQASTLGAYFDGSTTATATTLYGWSGTAQESTSLALTTPFTYFDGTFVSAAGVVYAWSSTANASTSTATQYQPVISLAQGSTPSPNVVVTFSDLDPATDVVNVWRTVDGKRRPVRGARRRSVVGSDFVTDYEAPLNRSISYDLEILSGVCAGVTVTTATTTITSSVSGWLSDPLAPSSAVPVYGDVGPNGEPGLDFDAFGQFEYKSEVSELIVMGTDEPVALVGQRQAANGIDLNATTLAGTQTTALRSLIKQAGVLLLRPVSGWASGIPGLCYLAAPSVLEQSVNEKMGGSMVAWKIKGDIVAPPAANAAVPTTTYGTVSGNYATYAAFVAAHPGQLYLDVIKSP